jgi:murein DD-endopeptidase MepM/ murein hydrolase activator NlpD
MSRGPVPQAQRPSEAVDRLVDALSEDVVATSTEKLLDEVTEDQGDRLAFVHEFDRALAQAVGQSKKTSEHWSDGLVARMRPSPRSLLFKPLRSSTAAARGLPFWKRPVTALVATLLIAVAAGDIYLHWQQVSGVFGAANMPSTTKPSPAASTLFRTPRASAPELAKADARDSPAQLPTGLDAVAQKRVRTATVRRDNLEDRQATPSGRTFQQSSVPVEVARPSPLPNATPRAAIASSEYSFGGPADPQNVSPAAPAAGPAPPVSSLGTLSFLAPVRGPIVMGFGRTDSGRQNEGIDYAVPEGTDVHAAEDGLVIYAGDDTKGYGNVVLVRHSNGFVTTYAHASELVVKTGDTVRRGEVIAKVGRTGNIPAPRLHFEIRRGTVPVDPMRYLSPG